MKKKILIADHLHPVFKTEAEKLGYVCDDMPQISREETIRILADYQVIAIRTKFQIDREIIEAGKNLKIIARAGAGMDNVDQKFAESRGVKCINAPEGNRDAVAEHTVGMLLSLANNLKKGDLEIRNEIWDREGSRGWELNGKTVGIVGYGNTGQKLARKLSGFDVRVIAYDKYKTHFSDENTKEADLEQLYRETDILSFHIPLTAETRYLFNDNFLDRFNKPIVVLNTSRGEIVSIRSVLDGIRSGKIIAAGLDVLEIEKFPVLGEQPWFNELIENDKVLLSPHVAGWTVESFRKISEVLAEKLRFES